MTTLQVILAILKFIETLSVLGIIAIGMDMAYFYFKGYDDATKESERKRAYQAQHRRPEKEKERSSWWGFFEGSYTPGFSSDGRLIWPGSQVMTAKGLEIYKELDRRADDAIFRNTEVL